MATPNGYILIKRSELSVPQTPSFNAVAASKEKELKVEVPEIEHEERKTIVLSAVPNLLTGSRSVGRGNMLTVGLPPSLDATQGFRKNFRYIAQGTSATNLSLVSVGTALISFGSMAIATDQVSSIISSFKIHSVTIYPASGATNTYLEWTDAATVGQHVKDERKLRPVPTGITVSAPIRYYPAKESESAFWQNGAGTATGLFAVLATAGSVIDVDATVTLLNSGLNVQQTGFTSLTVGLVYYPPLDGRATNRLAPVGRTTAV